jgi:hypothetical protein
MTIESRFVPAKRNGTLESLAATFESFLDRNQFWMLAFWSIIYFAGTILRARAKPFWYDELLTLLEARQPNLPAAMRALGDMDWMPPANHLTYYLWAKLAGTGEVAFRVPSIIAFWVFCICLYIFARRRVSVLFAMVALLLPFASQFQYYAYEARSYAFVLAFCGIALVSWQAAADRINRPWSLVGLALGFAGALAFQYWAVLFYLPLAAAEAYRNRQDRRIDWPIWAAFAAGGLSLVASLRLILHGLNKWVSATGMRAEFRDYRTSYTLWFHALLTFAILAALLLAVWWMAGGARQQPAGQRSALIPRYEWIAAGIMLLLPILAVSIALAVPPHSYAPRYAVEVVAGYALIVSFLLARFAGRRSALGLACALAALAPFLNLMAHPPHFRNPLRKMPGLEQRLKDGPVVVEDLLVYLKLWYYTPDALKPRLIYLTEVNPNGRPGLASKELGRVGISAMPYQAFARPDSQFVFYTTHARKAGQLISRIRQDGGVVVPVSSTRHAQIWLAHVKKVGPT